MEQGATSFLFAGTKFRKDKFAGVFARFQGKKEAENVDSDSSLLLSENTEAEVEQVSISSKKRKRKNSSASSVEGFSVFNSSKTTETAGSGEQDGKDSNEEAFKEKKKELNKQIERDAISRKGYGIHVSGNNIPSPLQSFAELSSRYGCEPYVLCNLKEFGFKEPTPIQRQAIPVILSGRECFACAPTGSGKTLAFVCPILMKLKVISKSLWIVVIATSRWSGLSDKLLCNQNPSSDGIRALILCPTRELALQTSRECMKMAQGNKFRIRTLKKEHLKNPNKLLCDILISTPLRLKIAISKKKVDLSRVEFLILDESDKLFELGMLKQTDYVVKACSNPSIVRSLFSATLPDYIEDLARSVMHDAVRVIIGRKNTASETIKQKLIFAGSEEGKLIALRQSFAESLNPPVLIFLQSKERAKELFEELKYEDIRVDVIHSDLSQKQRETSVDDFRAGKTWVLIATDVVARGMDFKGVNCVINYDFPDSAAAYIHRIGRTGRAGRSGEAVTLYTEADIPLVRNIGNLMNQKNQQETSDIGSVSGQHYEFPSWILDLPKRKWRKYRPGREAISTTPKGLINK
ncbi:DEAD-box ATP-dependent RNA helicase 57 [Linum perenne]